MHIYKATEWQSAITNYYHCLDTIDLAHGSSEWYLPCRILDITPAAFLQLLKEKYHATIKRITPTLISYYWLPHQRKEVLQFKRDINLCAKKKNFWI